MAIDQYSPCPCGSGKKMKFCKCVDQPQEYEKLIRLIEGGQELAAMDRINQMLAKTPNAAWLLAIKGELSLGMQELDTFQETAKRFLKLKPDNPLALIMNALACLIGEGSPQQAADYLLQGLAESRDSVPAMTPTAIELLCRSLVAKDMLSIAGYWAELQAAFSQQSQGESLLMQDPQLNLLAKAPSRVLEDPVVAGWKERLAEVTSLTKTFRFSQAETKLRAILRDFPDQPGPLSHLLRTEVALLNRSGAFATANKLARHLDVSEEDRAYFAALAMELDPKHEALQAESIWRLCEIDAVDRVTEGLGQWELAEAEVDDPNNLNMRQAYAAYAGDEVPAKAIYQIWDLPPVQGGAEAARERAVASLVATVVLFGKQTDKPARALVIGAKFPAYQAIYDQLEERLQLGPDVAGVEPMETTYAQFLSRPKSVVGATFEAPTIEDLGRLLTDEFLNLPLRHLGGLSPLQAAQEERHRGNLRALLNHLEGEQSLLVERRVIDELYRRLELPVPECKVDAHSESIQLRNILDIDRIDPSGLSDPQLQGLAYRAMASGATRVLYSTSRAILSRESMADNRQARSLALSAMRSLANTFDERLALSHELIALLESAQAPVGKVVVEMVTWLMGLNRGKEAQQLLLEKMQAHPEDPYLSSFVQYIGSQMGAAKMGAQQPLATAMQGASAGESLILPGQAEPSGGGESKLWLPGS